MRGGFIVVGLVLIVIGWIVPQYFGAPFVVACPPTASCAGPATVGNLVGYVTDSSSGAGIVGASIVLSVSGSTKYSTSSVTAGYYKFGAITSGGYTISVSASGYSSFQGSTGVSPGTTSTYSVQLAPLPLSGGSSGVSSGGGCTPTPSGTCNVPPPPAGVTAPPPPAQPTNQIPGTNQTINSLPGNPTYFTFVFFVVGVVFAGAGLVLRRKT